jgi:phage shock protein PspC (stress-responsive transcriptional regulator)
VTRGRNDLVRSTSDRVLGGVCAGIAHWLGWRPNTVRILYVLGSILSAAFPGTLVYLVLWVVMPSERGSRTAPVG